MSAAFSGLWHVKEQDFEIGAYYLEKELLSVMVYAWKTVINLLVSLSLRGKWVHSLFKKINSKPLSIRVLSAEAFVFGAGFGFFHFLFSFSKAILGGVSKVKY